MNTDQHKPPVAQPAEESLKKHGDQLQKPVDDVTRHQSSDNGEELKGKEAREE